jgi:cellulose synthase/poly-beta-1,6-N-acetylglucosamine synthase-like glycosyltransferase
MGREHRNGEVVVPDLFETRRAEGRIIYRIFSASVFVGIVLIWLYRSSNVPKLGEEGWLGWIGLFGAELWFGFYWVLTQATRWNRVYRSTFKDRLSQRHENDLPKVDIFVCTANHEIEPPMMVINTVLSVMSYDYPPEKLAVYLSDDGGSNLTFYALLEASSFSRHWIPFCKKFNVEPRSPAAYFASCSWDAIIKDKEFASVKKLYVEMENRVTTAVELGRIPENTSLKHKGFSQWNSSSTRRDHDTILQILIDGRDPNAKDIVGCTLPTLVYLAREKRPQHPHNFKAGAMNALIRVSSEISNGPLILNVDCDMYSNNSGSVRDALCFFMDEEKGHEIAYVQFPQNFENITKNDVYSSSLSVPFEVEFQGLDGYGGPMYIGTGCFHRRDTLCGREFSKENRIQWSRDSVRKNTKESADELEARVKDFASCAYEHNTEWGKKMGLRYGCPVEDVITGLSILFMGWKSIYYNPTRKAFLGIAPTSLDQMLLQHKRWSEGDFQIFLSRFSPAWYGLGRISPGLQMALCTYLLWAPNCLATIFYSVVPSLYLLRGISLFPQVSSPWILPFAYVIIAKYAYSLAEFLWSGGTVLGWWNDQRIWLYKRTTSYLFAFVDTILGLFGLSETSFIVTNKMSDPDASQRYEKEMMEFRTSFPMFTVLATFAMINLISLIWVAKRVVTDVGAGVFETMALQIILCGVLVMINVPLYSALFFRKDTGKMPSSITAKSVLLALFVCSCSLFLY